MLRKPLAIPGALPDGPPCRPPCYAQVHELCNHQELDEAMSIWYGKAREEWASLTGVNDQARTPKFVWEPMMGAAKEARKHGTTPAVVWRIAARSADTIADLIKQHASSNMLDRSRHDEAIATIASKLEKYAELLPAALATELAPQLKRMAGSVRAASAYNDERWVRSLATAARARAKKLEDAAAAAWPCGTTA